MLDLSRLSPDQRRAVLAGDGPLLIVAGPGSGKTTLLAARIAYLVAGRDVPPTGILALTFATQARRELQARLNGLLGPAAGAVDVSTFHAFGLRIIRQWGEVLGYGTGPLTVCGEAEARRLLDAVADEVGIDLGSWSVRDLARQVERYRLTVEPDQEPADTRLALLAAHYEALLRRHGLVDYPAMLVLPLRLFTAQPAVLRLLQDSYRFVLADEFQDICAAQYRLLQSLAARHRNLFAVGDPRQTLYGWRGANVRLFGAFRRDFPESQILGLDQNYRATGRLVELANTLASPLPYGRRLWTANPPGEPARLQVVADEAAEAAFVTDTIARLWSAGQVAHPGEVAVLYRANWQAERLTTALRAHHIPYRVRGSGDLFARREVRDVLAYLRLAHNPSDAAALARIANVPPRRLGRVAEAVRAGPVPTDDLPRLAARFGPAAVAAAEALAALIAELRARSADRGPASLLDLALERSGYHAWLAGQPDGSTRLAHLASLRALATTASDLDAWLAALQLGGDVPAADDAERVQLTTIHGAKGGEWRWVFVLGVEEGLLPHARALQGHGGEPDGIDAERRVAYVAVTRSREGLYLLCCRSRQRSERAVPRRPSRFLHGLPLTRAA